MKAYLIDPFEKSVAQVEYDGNYKNIYKLIDASMFDAAEINNDLDVVMVDDEGLFVPLSLQEYFYLRGLPRPFAGKGLVLGTDPEGESCAPRISLEYLRSLVLWPSKAQIKEFSDAGGFDGSIAFEGGEQVTLPLRLDTDDVQGSGEDRSSVH